MLAKQSQTISQVKRRLMQKSKGLNGGGCLNARMCTCIFCIPTALINKHDFLCKTTGQTSFQQVPYPMARPGEELLLVVWVFFLVKDDPCGMYRSDKGTWVGSLRPFYSPLRRTDSHSFPLHLHLVPWAHQYRYLWKKLDEIGKWCQPLLLY